MIGRQVSELGSIIMDRKQGHILAFFLTDQILKDNYIMDEYGTRHIRGSQLAEAQRRRIIDGFVSFAYLVH